MVDCPGAFNEDEGFACSTENYRSCVTYYTAGFTESGKYLIKPLDGFGKELPCQSQNCLPRAGQTYSKDGWSRLALDVKVLINNDGEAVWNDHRKTGITAGF